jgi:predicted transcriptional regulator
MGPQGTAWGKLPCTVANILYNSGMVKKFSEQLRTAVKKSGVSRYRLAKRAGVADSVLSRFVHGAGLRTDSIDRIVDALDLELKPRPRRKGK